MLTNNLIYCNSYLLANEPLFFRKPPFPKKLSQWNIFVKKQDTLYLNERVKHYQIRNSLFSDYAEKFRTIWIPKNTIIELADDLTLKYPNGTIITKTFAYNKNEIKLNDSSVEPLNTELAKYFDKYMKDFKDLYLIETRILVKGEKSWYALPYVWDKEQNEAMLKPIGMIKDIEITNEEIGTRRFFYQVPNMNQCKGCHIDHEEYKKTIRPIGPHKFKNLDTQISQGSISINQMEAWYEESFINRLPDSETHRIQLAKWEESIYPINDRARAYLDINCAHCHSPKGPANTSGLFLNFENNNLSSLGYCKKPVAAGKAGSKGEYDIDPQNPEKSILYHRMLSEDPGIMMPELGRSISHIKGVELIYNWIAGSEETSCY